MSLLQQLGINSTVFIQFILYIGIFAFLGLYVFVPYANASNERDKKTKGAEDLVNDFQRQSIELHSEYEIKVREIHHHIQEIYRQLKLEATTECEKIIGNAKKEASETLNASRRSLQLELASTEEGLKNQTLNLGMAIANQILRK